jgi:hypothetical protein
MLDAQQTDARRVVLARFRRRWVNVFIVTGDCTTNDASVFGSSPNFSLNGSWYVSGKSVLIGGQADAPSASRASGCGRCPFYGCYAFEMQDRRETESDLIFDVQVALRDAPLRSDADKDILARKRYDHRPGCRRKESAKNWLRRFGSIASVLRCPRYVRLAPETRRRRGHLATAELGQNRK